MLCGVKYVFYNIYIQGEKFEKKNIFFFFTISMEKGKHEEEISL